MSRGGLWSSSGRWLASFLVSWLHFVPLALVSPFSREAAHRVYRNWARVSLRIFGITCSLRDDNAGPVAQPALYVWLNQSNLAEGPIISLLLPPYFWIVNIEYAAMPLLGWARAALGDVVIIRQWQSQARRGIARAAARMSRGESCAMSIEGKRTPDGSLQPFKKGPFLLALEAGAPIVPMVLHGGSRILSRTWRIQPGHVELHLLEAIPVKGLRYDDRHAVLDQLRALAERELGAQPGAPRVAPLRPA